MPGGHSNRMRQVSFRGRNDDGVEGAAPPPVTTSGATWIAGLNENWDQRPSTPFRVRILVEQDPLGFGGFNTPIGLRSSYNGEPFIDVTSGTQFIRSINSSFYADQDESTDFVGRLGTGVWADITDNGGAVGQSGSSKSVNFGQGLDEIEIEFCLEIVSAEVVNGDTIELQGRQSTAGFGDGYTESPLITVFKPISIVTTATGVQDLSTENQISWEQVVDAPVGSGTMLLAFVGGVDSQRPSITSATLSGSAKSPLPEVPLTTAIEVVGAGGSSFPSAWISYLGSPFASVTGTVTGTITMTFDDEIGRFQGMSAIVSGTNGQLDSASSITQHTQPPGFDITNTHLTTTTGVVLVDMCISESSNHNDHIVGTGQERFGLVVFSGPMFSTSARPAGQDEGAFELVRSGSGGPFAVLNLIVCPLDQ